MDKWLSALGVFGASSSATLLIGNAALGIGVQQAGYLAAFFLGALLLLYFLAQREARRIFAILDRVPAPDWFDEVKSDLGRIPSTGWFADIQASVMSGHTFRNEMERRVSFIEGKMGLPPLR